MRTPPLALVTLLLGWLAFLGFSFSHDVPVAVAVQAVLVLVAGVAYALDGGGSPNGGLWLAVVLTSLGPVLAATAPFPHASPTRRVVEVGLLELLAVAYAARDKSLRTLLTRACRWHGARKTTLVACLTAVPLGIVVRQVTPTSPITLSTSAGAARLAAAVIAVTVFSALPEEIVFRGVLTPRLSSFGPVALVAGTLAAYGGSYALGGSWRLWLVACVLGLAAMAVRLRSRSLVPVVCAHCVLSITVLTAIH
jgi:membrane protease YdiL (CAAX protease family)